MSITKYAQKGRNGIRTHEPVYRPDGFQDRSLKPDLGILPDY